MNTIPYQLSDDEKRVIEFEARAAAANGASRGVGEHISTQWGGGLSQQIAEINRTLANMRERDPAKEPIEKRLAHLQAVRAEWQKHHAAYQAIANPAKHLAVEVRRAFEKLKGTASKAEADDNG